MEGKGKNNSTNLLDKIKTGLGNDFENVSFQIDLINSEVTPQTDIVNFLNNNSSRLQHLLDEEPRLIRWWFDDINVSLKAMSEIAKVKDLAHRLICIEKNVLFIQNGHI